MQIFSVANYDESWEGGEQLYSDIKKVITGPDLVMISFEGDLTTPIFILASVGQIFADLGPEHTDHRLFFLNIPSSSLAYIYSLSRQLLSSYLN